MALMFNKKVMLKNRRLERLYQFLLAIVALAWALHYFLSSQYLDWATYTQSELVSVWLPVQPSSTLMKGNLNASYCEAHHCSRAMHDCNAAHHGSCFDYHLANRQEQPGQAFVATRVQQWSGHRVEPASTQNSSDSIVATAALQAIGISYSFHSKPRWLGSELRLLQDNPQAGPPPQVMYTSKRDSYTIFLQSDGSPWRTFAPGEEILITVADLLWLASQTHALESLQDALGRPSMQEGEEAAVLGARCGGQVDIRLECFKNDVPVILKGAEERPDGAPVCYASVDYQTAWTTRSPDYVWTSGASHGDWHPVTTFLHGLRIRAHLHGKFAHFSFRWTLLNLLVLVLLLHTPKRLVRWVAVRRLGAVSQIYRHVLREEFSFGACASTAALQMLTQAAVYTEIDTSAVKAEEGATGKQGIQWKQFDYLLSMVGRNLEKSKAGRTKSMRSFADYAWTCLTVPEFKLGYSQRKNIDAQVKEHVRTSLWMESLPEVLESGDLHRASRTTIGDEQKVVNLERFVAASAMTDQVTFDSLLQLFDERHEPGFLERIFMDRSLRTVKTGMKELLAEQASGRAPGEKTSDPTDSSGTEEWKPYVPKIIDRPLRIDDLRDEADRFSRVIRQGTQDGVSNRRLIITVADAQKILLEKIKEIVEKINDDRHLNLYKQSKQVAHVSKRVDAIERGIEGCITNWHEGAQSSSHEGLQSTYDEGLVLDDMGEMQSRPLSGASAQVLVKFAGHTMSDDVLCGACRRKGWLVEKERRRGRDGQEATRAFVKYAAHSLPDDGSCWICRRKGFAVEAVEQRLQGQSKNLSEKTLSREVSAVSPLVVEDRAVSVSATSPRNNSTVRFVSVDPSSYIEEMSCHPRTMQQAVQLCADAGTQSDPSMTDWNKPFCELEEKIFARIDAIALSTQHWRRDMDKCLKDVLDVCLKETQELAKKQDTTSDNIMSWLQSFAVVDGDAERASRILGQSLQPTESWQQVHNRLVQWQQNYEVREDFYSRACNISKKPLETQETYPGSCTSQCSSTLGIEDVVSSSHSSPFEAEAELQDGIVSSV